MDSRRPKKHERRYNNDGDVQQLRTNSFNLVQARFFLCLTLRIEDILQELYRSICLARVNSKLEQVQGDTREGSLVSFSMTYVPSTQTVLTQMMGHVVVARQLKVGTA